MGTILEVCTCFAQETVVPNSKSMVGIEDNNIDIKNEKKNEDTCSPNNIIDKKNNKNNNKIGTNIHVINDSETYKKELSKISKKTNKKNDNKKKRESIRKNEEEKSNGRKVKKKKDKDTKSNEDSKRSNSLIVKRNDEELFDKNNISSTILSELILEEKIKYISKEKKKLIKGRNYINILILGDNEVGKSTFCIRYVENKFEDFYIPSIGKEDYSKTICYNGRYYKLNFTVIFEGDTIKRQDNLFLNADFFLIIYDITKIKSFNLINIYLKQLKKNIFSYDKDGKLHNFCLAGNKSDLEAERKISSEIINQYITKYGINHFDISLKTGFNVNNLIMSLTQIFDKIAFSNK